MLRTKRLYLRPWRPDDAAALYRLASDPEVGPPAGWPPHRTIAESEQLIRDAQDEPETYAVTRREDGALLGYAGLRFGEDACSESPSEPELGYWFGRAFWGNGYAPEAAERLLRRAFDDLSAEAVWCCCFEGNRRSARVAEKLGFRLVRINPEGETRLGYSLSEAEMVLCGESFRRAWRLETERLLLRRFQPEDWRDLRRIARDFQSSPEAVYDVWLPLDEEGIRAAAQRFSRSGLHFAVFPKGGGKMAGYIGLREREGNFDLGYCFHSDSRGRGYALESCRAALDYVEQSFPVMNLTAGTALENGRSVSLLQKLGFVKTGAETLSFHKDGSGHDIPFTGGAFVRWRSGGIF